jgi:hypothetical protein
MSKLRSKHGSVCLEKDKKTFKNSSWGGSRQNAGRAKRYDPIVLGFAIENEETILKALKLAPQWILEDKISTYRARALVYALKTLYEIYLQDQNFAQRLLEVEAAYFVNVPNKTKNRLYWGAVRDILKEIKDQDLKTRLLDYVEQNECQNVDTQEATGSKGQEAEPPLETVAQSA